MIQGRRTPPLRPRQIAQRGRRRREKVQRQVMTSSDILLIIFRHYLDASPPSWFKLAHVCQSWRRIIFGSPLGLDLRLYCTSGTPVIKSLDCWPPLPLVVNYGTSPMHPPPSPEDEDNVMAALEQSDRVCSINLTVTSSLLKKLSTISEPLSRLEDLVLLSQDDVWLILPSTFWWGHRLRTLHLTRIAIPSLPQLLLPSQDLVDLQLHEIPGVGYISPEAFANALCGMTQLKILSIHFLSLPPRRNYLSFPPPPGDRVVLPALTCFKYRGISKYLDSLVARIDAPGLKDIDITFFNQPTLDASQLGLFINRIDLQRSPLQADILSSRGVISITFTQPGVLVRFKLQISCKQLDWQLSSIAQICDHFSAFLSNVGDLSTKTIGPTSVPDDMDGEQWLRLIRAFNGAKDFRVAGELAADILLALRLADEGHETVLPLLRNLHLQEPGSVYGLSQDSVLQSFLFQRQLSGRPVQVQPTPLGGAPIHNLPKNLVDMSMQQLSNSYGQLMIFVEDGEKNLNAAGASTSSEGDMQRQAYRARLDQQKQLLVDIRELINFKRQGGDPAQQTVNGAWLGAGQRAAGLYSVPERPAQHNSPLNQASVNQIPPQGRIPTPQQSFVPSTAQSNLTQMSSHSANGLPSNDGFAQIPGALPQPPPQAPPLALQRTIQCSKFPPLPEDRFKALFTQFANTTGLRLNDRDFIIDGRPVSAWALHRAVFARNGFDLVTANDEWPAVGAALGFPSFIAGDPTQPLRCAPSIAHLLQQLYNDSLRHFEQAYLNNDIARLRNSQALSQVSAQTSQQQMHLP